MKKLFLLVSLTTFSLLAMAAENEYAGQQQREIKALSAEDIDGYLSGKGMGMAKAAELNNYPGPKHVLELADNLELTTEQRRQTEALFAEMKSAAVTLGTKLVAKEKMLDAAFAEQTIQFESLQQLLSEIGQLQAQLRGTHLQAHLKQRAVLNETQLSKYDQLRGYAANKQHSHAEHSDH